jgi:glutamyl-tRNA synthetase
VNKAGAIFNLDKLRWFNQEYMRRRPVDQMVEELRPLLAERGWSGFDDAYVSGVVELMRGRITFVHELLDRGGYFFADPDAYDQATVKKRWKPASSDLLARFLPRLENLPEFTAAAIEEELKSFAEEAGPSPGAIIHPLRLAVSGTGAGPGLYDLLETLGRETCVRRVQSAVEALG